MITAGTSSSVTLIVTDDDTAVALGSGDISVLGTPRVIALCEEAAVTALLGTLPEGATTVGVTVSLDHFLPTAIGATVTATATITEVARKKISFTLVVTEGELIAARGTHMRIVVDRERFEKSAYS